MAGKKSKKKGSWAGGKAPAQGSTPQKITKPEGKKGKLKSSMMKGKKTAKRKGTS